MDEQNNKSNLNPNALDQQVQTNNNQSPDENILTNLIQNKRLVLFFILGSILLISVIYFSNVPVQNQQTSPSPTIVPPTPAEETFPTNAQPTRPTNGSTEPTDPSQVIEIKTQIKPELDTLIENEYEIFVTKVYPGGWANLRVADPDESMFDAAVVAKKENGVWKVLLGPGTYFTSQDMKEIGAPQEVINDLTTE